MTRMPERLPEDVDAERSLLCTIAGPGALDPMNSDPECLNALIAARPELFVHPAHKAVFESVRRLHSIPEEINLLTLKADLETHGTLSKVGGFPGLVEMLNFEDVMRPTVLVARLEDLWRSRQIIHLSGAAIRRSAEGMEGSQEIISDMATKLTLLASNNTGVKLRTGGVLIDRLMSGLAFRQPGAAHKLIHLGIPSMDEAMEASPSHNIVIGARPGVGKSALAVQGVWSTAKAGGRPFLVSLEMDEDEIDARLVSWQTREGYKTFRGGYWKQEHLDSMLEDAEAAERIVTWCHPSGVPWAKVEAAIRDAVRIHGCTSVWIDHALLIQKPNLGKGANDAACWGELSRGIKRIAQELRICTVPLLQLNRQGAVGEPKLSDLKESGSWEEDANGVWMLWNKDENAVDTMADSKTVFSKAAKMRSGPSGWKKELNFEGAINRFTEIVHETSSTASTGSFRA